MRCVWLTVLVQFRNRICVKNYLKNADSHNKREGLNMAVESGNMFIWPLGLLFVEMFASKNLYMLGRVQKFYSRLESVLTHW